MGSVTSLLFPPAPPHNLLPPTREVLTLELAVDSEIGRHSKKKLDTIFSQSVMWFLAWLMLVINGCCKRPKMIIAHCCAIRHPDLEPLFHPRRPPLSVYCGTPGDSINSSFPISHSSLYCVIL